LMESPALIVSLFILKNTIKNDHADAKVSWAKLLHESLVNSSVFLILGSLFVGVVASEKSYHELAPFTEGLFKGFLALFLLDMGIVAAKRISALAKGGVFLISFAIILPLINASIAILLSYFLGISQGNAFLLAVLSASASYIAVPAAVRLTIPEANPGLFVPMALAITFPFNITVGLPLYYSITHALWS
ncbi:MAG: sodium-dependent bicarbonate transport family permease, partial [Bacteroidia bacterium]